LPDILSWFVIACGVGALGGTVTAWFLIALEYVTNTRLQNPWLIYLLPLAGVAIAFVYRKFGKNSELGNNLLIDEIHNPQAIVPLRMAPLVLLGTLATHLFGGSAGREGTAIQMGGALADQFTKILRLTHERRKVLLMSGISAGFAAVFGTPLAGAVFGFEVLAIGRVKYNALLPCFTAAVIADRVCRAWGVNHQLYNIISIPSLGLFEVGIALLAGACFGLCAYIFSWASHRSHKFFKLTVPNTELRALLGGLIVVAAVALLQTDRYLGLGIPVIVESFQKSVPFYDFFLKMAFTIITLSSGFKGGEVTPLFFIGATLGNALAWVLPLPMSLLSGMGFVAVFAGAANTPLACILMSFELFGPQASVYTALACVASYVFSGHAGIYHSQRVEVEKYATKN
jgi:H+/Cl- antiporter ClcA